MTKLLFNKWGGATAFGEGGMFYKLQEDGVTWKQSHTAIHFLLLDGAFGDDLTLRRFEPSAPSQVRLCCRSSM